MTARSETPLLLLSRAADAALAVSLDNTPGLDRLRPRVIRNVGLAAICALLVNVLVNLRAGQRTEALICGLGVVGAVGSVALARRPATQRRAAHYLLGLAWLVVTSAGMVGSGFYH